MAPMNRGQVLSNVCYVVNPMSDSAPHPPDIRARRDRVIEEKKSVTGRISDTCRFVGFGLLAIFYALHTGENELALRIRSEAPWKLFVMGAFGVLTILLDYLHYFFGSRAVTQASP